MQHQINFQNTDLWHFCAIAHDAGIGEVNEEEVMNTKILTINVSEGYEIRKEKKLVRKPDGTISEDIHLNVYAIESATGNDVDQNPGRQNSFDNCPIG
jgi:hypothetical protein